ncbi:hypothetical protein RFG06_004515, partial [Klebsiella pneumoniae]
RTGKTARFFYACGLDSARAMTTTKSTAPFPFFMSKTRLRAKLFITNVLNNKLGYKLVKSAYNSLQ